MIYRFTKLNNLGTYIELESEEGVISIPTERFSAVLDESGLVSIKTVGSRAVIGTIPEDAYNEGMNPPGPEPEPTYEYVDLGLPSGTLWAKFNIGAEKESDYGLYFQWGDAQGYTRDQVGTDKVFDWRSYKYSDNGGLTKYNTNSSYGTVVDNKTVLESSDDAATALWGSSWCMPTDEQLQELITETNNEWTTIDDVNGYKFTNKNDNTKYIFIPAAGIAEESSVNFVGYSGGVWSRSLSPSYPNRATLLLFLSYFTDFDDDVRYGGYSVRPVKKGPEPPRKYKATLTLTDDTTVIDEFDTPEIPSTEYRQRNDIKSVSLEEGFTSIGERAFGQMQNLESVTLPSTLTSLGTSAFILDRKLSSINIPQNLTSLPFSVFYGSGLRNITIPSNITEIGVAAFAFSRSLESVTLPSTLTEIPKQAFDTCESLTSVTLPNSVKSIGEKAFADNTSLTSITFPASVEEIGKNALYGNTGLTYIEVGGDTPFILGQGAFENTNNCPIYVPCENVDVFRLAWQVYEYRIECIPVLVDLGLPSRTKWFTRNLGAEKETDSGLYFQWGDTQGYTRQEVGTEKVFDWTDYKWCNGSQNTLTKYCTDDENWGGVGPKDDLTYIMPSDDAARAVGKIDGYDAEMPSLGTIQELLDNTDQEWVTNYKNSGKNGVLLVSKINGQRIFFPAAGFARYSRVENSNYSLIWTGGINPDQPYNADALILWSTGQNIDSYRPRVAGLNIRPILAVK